MYVSEIITEISKYLNNDISTSIISKFNYNEYMLYGPVIKPQFLNRPTYSYLVPFLINTRGGKLYIIDFSKIQNAFETVIKTYYFTTNFTARDAHISLLAIISEKDAMLEITSKGLTSSHFDILKTNLTIMNQLVVKLIENDLIDVINNS